MGLQLNSVERPKPTTFVAAWLKNPKRIKNPSSGLALWVVRGNSGRGLKTLLVAGFLRATKIIISGKQKINMKINKKLKYVFWGVVAIFVVSLFIGGDSTPAQPSKPTYKIDFTDGSTFYAEDFSRIDVKGSGGNGCVEFVTMTSYTSESGEVTDKGETMLHCGTYTFSPPYPEDN